MNKSYKTNLGILLIIIFAINLSACDALDTTKGQDADSTIQNISEETTDTDVSDKTDSVVSKVEVQTVSNESIENTLSYIGTVLPSEEIIISSRAEGVVSEIHVKEGETIKSGDILADISDPAGANSAQISNQMAGNNLENAKSLLLKAKTVNAENLQMANISLSTSQQQLDDARKALSITTASNQLSVSSTETQLQNSKNALARLENSVILGQQQMDTNNQNIIEASNISLDNVYSSLELSLLSTFPAIVTTLDNVDDLPNGLNGIENDLEDLQDDLDDVRKNDLDSLKDLVEDTQDFILDFIEFLNDIEPDEAGYSLVGSILPAMEGVSAQLQGLNSSLTATENSFNALNINHQVQLQVLLDQVDNLKEQIDLQEIALENAKKQISLSEHSLNSNINLLIKGVETKNIQLNLTQLQSTIEIENLENQIETLEYQLKQSSLQTGYLQIKATTSGVISNIHIEKGQLVYPREAVVTIFQSNKRETVISANPKDLSILTSNTKAEITLKNDDQIYEGQITKINPIADPISHLVDITITISDAPEIFIPNSIVEVQIPLELSEDKIYIPLKSVLIREEGNHVFILEKGKTKKIDVELGEIYDSKVHIISGLDFGDMLITEGHRTLEEGANVEIMTN